jgi:hypothetical protein
MVAGVLSLAALAMLFGCALPQRPRRSLERVRQCWSYIAYMDFTMAMVTCKGDCEALPAGEYEAQSGLERVLFYFKHGPGRPRANRTGAADFVIRDPQSRDMLGALYCVAYRAEVRPDRFLLDGGDGSRILEIRPAE